MENGFGNTGDDVEDDRLSPLSDNLIHRILSFISSKHALKTSILSSRWRFIWTSTPYLNFSSEDFHTFPEFSHFVAHVLSHRNNQIEVSSLNITFGENVTDVFVENILDYAFSHNVQHMTIRILLNNNNTQFFLSLFSSQCLKHLTLTGSNIFHVETKFVWDLSALTTLHLDYITLCNKSDRIDIFSKCANLKNLTLKHCQMTKSDGFGICHPRLRNLWIENTYWDEQCVKVCAPELKKLTIIENRGTNMKGGLLRKLMYRIFSPVKYLLDGLLSLEKVDLRIYHKDNTYAHNFAFLLQQLHNVKFLTLNVEIIELLSSYPGLISLKPSPFGKLTSLKVYPEREEVIMSTEVKNYLLYSSPIINFTVVSHEMIAKSAQKLKGKLHDLLKLWKANSKTNKAKTHVIDTRRNYRIEERMTHIENFWKDLNIQLEDGNKKTCQIISMLREIEGLLSKLPPLEREKKQARFSSLCAEADIVMNDIVECMKIQFDKKPCLLHAKSKGSTSTLSRNRPPTTEADVQPNNEPLAPTNSNNAPQTSTTNTSEPTMVEIRDKLLNVEQDVSFLKRSMICLFNHFKVDFVPQVNVEIEDYETSTCHPQQSPEAPR